MTATIIAFPNPAERESDRLDALIDASGIDHAAGALGTADEWAWSAVSYLKCMLSGTQGGYLGGTVEVSAAAICIVLGYVESLASEMGVIPSPNGVA